mgnify:CR=1 FL=1
MPPDFISHATQSGVTQIGRYGRWIFQGIADSIAEGLAAGAAAVPR